MTTGSTKHSTHFRRTLTKVSLCYLQWEQTLQACVDPVQLETVRKSATSQNARAMNNGYKGTDGRTDGRVARPRVPRAAGCRTTSASGQRHRTDGGHCFSHSQLPFARRPHEQERPVATPQCHVPLSAAVPRVRTETWPHAVRHCLSESRHCITHCRTWQQETGPQVTALQALLHAYGKR